MNRKMTPAEMAAHRKELQAAGAAGRIAIVCKCGHIDYVPNDAAIANCVITQHECVECKS